jgi:hypothetical protein
MNKFSAYIENLHVNNSKSFYLAILRVVLSLWLLKELLFNWTSLEILYGKKSFIVFHTNALFELFNINTEFMHEHYKLLIALYAIVLSFNIVGIGRNFTALLVYLFVELFQRMNHLTLNGGDNLAKFILLYLVFANTYEHFVLNPNKTKNTFTQRSSNLLSNLAAYSIIIHLCLAYFIAGISKVHSDAWYNGIATYYILSLERFKGTTFNELLVRNGWFVLISSYFTIIFELYFPVLVWIKKFRVPLMVMGIALHMGIYIFMMIYGFQFIFLLTYGLFFSNKEILRFKENIIRRFAFFQRQSTSI